MVENVAVRREPLPKMAGVYFITPSNESVSRLIEDFSDQPLYASAHVFFSSPAPQSVLAAIRSCPRLTARLKSLQEVSRCCCCCCAALQAQHSGGQTQLTPTSVRSAGWHVSAIMLRHG